MIENRGGLLVRFKALQVVADQRLLCLSLRRIACRSGPEDLCKKAFDWLWALGRYQVREVDSKRDGHERTGNETIALVQRFGKRRLFPPEEIDLSPESLYRSLRRHSDLRNTIEEFLQSLLQWIDNILLQIVR